MEKFVDRIIETDKKARDIIEKAQHEKGRFVKEAEARAAKGLAERAAKNEKAMAQLDAELAAQEAAAMEQADDEYIRLKHGLDEDFSAGHDGWLKDIVAACTQA